MAVRWLTVVGLVLITGGAVWWLWQIALLDPTAQSAATGYGQLVLAALGTIVMLASAAIRRFTPDPLPPVDVRADELAKVMLETWEKAVVERDLTTPLPIHWRSAGPDRGNLKDLYTLYTDLPAQRLIITGKPGAGKTAAGILLLVDALTRRATAENRTHVPVPVMVTLHGWDPTTTSVRDWLVARLAEIPGFDRGARDLVNRVAVFLDGFDEIDEALRPTVLRQLSRQATFRLVLLSRTDELAAAGKQHALVGAVTVELRPLDADVAADHLLSRFTEPPPAWQAVADHLRTTPTSPLTRTLRNPFLLTLLRDAYPPAGPVDELLDSKRFRKAAQLETHLLDRALDAAYASGPERLPQRYSPQAARRTLTYLAHQLNQRGTRDLAWWEIPQWTDRPLGVILRAHVVVAVVAVLTGALLGLSYWLATGQPVVTGLPIGLVVGYVCAFMTIRSGLTPKRTPPGWWRTPFRPRALLTALPGGFGVALVLTLVDSTLPGVLGWITTGVVTWLALGFGASLFSGTQDDGSALDPPRSWRQDARSGLAFTAVAALGAFVIGLGFGSRFGGGVLATLAIGALGGLAGAVWIWPTSTTTWPVFCAQAQLTLTRRTPLRLLRFLEDARQRQVLRTAGPVYQFRHATLQDRLASGVDPDVT